MCFLVISLQDAGVAVAAAALAGWRCTTGINIYHYLVSNISILADYDILLDISAATLTRLRQEGELNTLHSRAGSGGGVGPG